MFIQILYSVSQSFIVAPSSCFRIMFDKRCNSEKVVNNSFQTSWKVLLTVDNKQFWWVNISKLQFMNWQNNTIALLYIGKASMVRKNCWNDLDMKNVNWYYIFRTARCKSSKKYRTIQAYKMYKKLEDILLDVQENNTI